MIEASNWNSDPTGRFTRRPYFRQEAIDLKCEQLVADFLIKKHGKISYPIGTEDLKLLVEDYAGELDLYADLSREGLHIEGVTEFFRSDKPVVRISITLTEDETRGNRLRTTLTHELGHVVLHSSLTSLSRENVLRQTTERDSSLVLRCDRDAILQAGPKRPDWMEWQAGYASGSFLIPKAELEQVISEFRKSSGHSGPIYRNQTHALALERVLQGKFQVSKQAARVRLSQLNLVED